MNERANQIEFTNASAVAGHKFPARCSGHGRRASRTPLVPPVLRVVPCHLTRPLRAALYAAEFAEWQASGGDYLCSRLAALFIPTNRDL